EVPQHFRGIVRGERETAAPGRNELPIVARLDGDERRVPAAGPAVDGARIENFGVSACHVSPVGLGDGSELQAAESLWRQLLHLGGTLRVAATGGGQRLIDEVDEAGLNCGMDECGGA